MKSSLSGHPIRNLQIMLRTLQLDRHVPCTVVSDGVYGPQTRQAVSDFQQRHDLPATGTADAATWNLIVSEYETAAINTGCTCPLKIRMEPGQRICSGSMHPCIPLVQSLLMLLDQQFHCIGCTEATGIWDEATANAISAFQKIAGLNCTGQLDKETWKHLALQYPLAVSRRIKEFTECT